MTMKPINIMLIVGTRPEVIKLAPVAIAAQKYSEFFKSVVVSTGQHRQMLDQMLKTFEIETDYDLNIMKDQQSLADITSEAIKGLCRVIEEEKPDIVVVQGDTTTSFIGALAAFYNRVAVAHVEAGLRTYNKFQPYPEEVNRRLITQIADLHFAPTPLSKKNLLTEGISRDKITVTGNTCIDALELILAKSRTNGYDALEGRNILLTTHRRENHGKPMQEICEAALKLVSDFEDINLIYPMHMSPHVRNVVVPILGSHPRVHLIEPLDYEQFINVMKNSYMILTDSGGVQEEAPSLGKPILVLRDETERPEGIEAGTSILVGTDQLRIIEASRRLLLDRVEYSRIAQIKNPYGDGNAAYKILSTIAGQNLVELESWTYN